MLNVYRETNVKIYILFLTYAFYIVHKNEAGLGIFLKILNRFEFH